MKSVRRVLFFLMAAMPVTLLPSVAVFAGEKPVVEDVSFRNIVDAVVAAPFIAGALGNNSVCRCVIEIV